MAEEYILMKVFAASGNAIEVDGGRTKIFLCERQKCLKIGIYQYKWRCISNINSVLIGAGNNNVKKIEVKEWKGVFL